MTQFTTALKRNVLPITTLLAVILFSMALILPGKASAALLTQQLDFGMTNSDVTSLQTFLAINTTIYPEGIVSGYFGSLTRSAVSRFQTANGLPSVGRVGPLTLATINSQMGGVVTNPEPTGDVSGPIMYPEAISLSTNSATISWTTNESARGRIMYSSTWPFLYSTAPSVSASGFGSTANLTVTNLQSKATYYYVLESIDSVGNFSWTTGKTFTTQ